MEIDEVSSNKGDTEMVKLLLEKKADINAPQNNKEETPLHLAALEGNTEMVELLLQKEGVNINAKDIDNNTPLYLAYREKKMGSCENATHQQT